MVDLSVWEQAARAARDADILSVAAGALAVGVAFIAAGLIRRGRTAVACAALVAAAVLAVGARGLSGEQESRTLDAEVGYVWGVSQTSCDTGVSYGLPSDGSYPCSWTKNGKTVKGTLRIKGSKAELLVDGKALKPARDV